MPERMIRRTGLKAVQIAEDDSMVKVYCQSGKLPVRMPLYIAIVAMARYLIIDIKNLTGNRELAIAGAALILALTVFVVRYGHIKFPYPSSRSDVED